MSVISTHSNAIKFFYSPDALIAKQALGYVKSTKKDILVINVTKTDITGTMWKTFTDGLNCKIEDLVSKSHKSFKTQYEDNLSLDENGWIKILNNNPEVLIHPILLIADEYHFIKTPSDVQHLLEPNSVD